LKSENKHAFILHRITVTRHRSLAYHFTTRPVAATGYAVPKCTFCMSPLLCMSIVVCKHFYIDIILWVLKIYDFASLNLITGHFV